MPIPKAIKTPWLLVLLVIGGCGSQEGARFALPGKVGASGEIVVVCENSVWSGAVGDTLRSIFGKPFPVLPQYEPWFDLVHLTPESFDRFWKPHRNIIDLVLADRVDTQVPSVSIYREKYARNQIYIEGAARTSAGLALALAEREEEMRSILHRTEVERFGLLMALDENEVIKAELAERMQLELTLPRDARWAKKNDEMGWIDRQLTRMKGGDNHDVQQGFVVYREPYTSDEQFSMQARLDKRNAIMRAHLPGPTKGSYMTTEMRYIPSYEETVFNGQFASELRGLWRIENNYMGGPFYSLTVLDERSGELVTVEGYTYAPYFDKREYMREAEAVVRSLQWADPTKQKE
ncbi:MAG: DUF4837 family protein [Flavobacteriales bacterium]|nr:DUF4837 family protein [Flavobacteriales bacterium]